MGLLRFSDWLISEEATAVIDSLNPQPPIDVLEALAGHHQRFRALVNNDRKAAKNFAHKIVIHTDHGDRILTAKAKRLYWWTFVRISRVVAYDQESPIALTSTETQKGFMHNPGYIVLVFDVI